METLIHDYLTQLISLEECETAFEGLAVPNRVRSHGRVGCVPVRGDRCP